MGKHNAPKGTSAGNPNQPHRKHRTEAKPASEPVMGRITRDMIEGVRGHVNDDTAAR
ncbi:MAG TPA: hypothetical protein VFB74_33935 [Kribbellaceae bacterium]|nr:hypothetical protein [Kribbellaceae bacterium]